MGPSLGKGPFDLPANMLKLRMKRHFHPGSTALSGVIAVAMALYLLQGKTVGWSLDARVMLGFASVLFVQSAVALWYRVAGLAGHPVGPPWSGMKQKELPCDADVALREAGAKGFRLLYWRAGPGGLSLYGKRLKGAYALEAAAYFCILLVISLGFMFYLFRVTVHADLSAGTEWVDMKTYVRDQGLLVGPERFDFKVRATELEYGGKGRPSRMVVEAMREGGETESHALEDGADFIIVGQGMRYAGNKIIAFLRVTRDRHDYSALPASLVRDGREGLYHGRILFAEPNASGEIEYNAETDKFRVKVKKGGEEVFNEEMSFAEVVRKDGFEVYVPARLHAGMLTMVRHQHRSRLALGLMVLSAIVVLRMVVMPKYFVLYGPDEGRPGYATNDRALRAAMKQRS